MNAHFSPINDLGLNFSNNTDRPFSHELLMEMQYILQNLIFVVTNEFSMIRSIFLYHMDLR